MSSSTDQGNPVAAAIAALVKAGWSDDEAKRLLRALRADTPEQLCDIVNAWIEHCCWVRTSMTLLECVAMGPIVVRHNGEDWTFALRDAAPAAEPEPAGLTD